MGKHHLRRFQFSSTWTSQLGSRKCPLQERDYERIVEQMLISANLLCAADDEPIREMLERESQAELDLAGSTQRVNARSDAHSVHIMALRSSPVYLACSSRQKPIQHVPRKVKIREVEQIIECHAGLNGEALLNSAGPAGFQIDSAEPGEIDFTRRCERHGRRHCFQLLQLRQRE